MQIGQNNKTSFGFNSIKFVDEASEQVFNRKNAGIKPELLKQVLEEVKNIKPKVGSDVDVYISGILKGSDREASCLTYKEHGSMIRKGCIQLDQLKKHTVESIKEAFQKLANQVDDLRGMEKELYEEKLNNPCKRMPIKKPPFMK